MFVLSSDYRDRVKRIPYRLYYGVTLVPLSSPFILHNVCINGLGMYSLVCGMENIKYPLLLINL